MTRALVLFLLLISLTPHARASTGGSEPAAETRPTPRAPLSDSALARAEKLIAELARLDDAATTARPEQTRRAAHAASEIFLRAQSLPDGDLKVDLSTAARLYERAFARAPVMKSLTSVAKPSTTATKSSTSRTKPSMTVTESLTSVTKSLMTVTESLTNATTNATESLTTVMESSSSVTKSVTKPGDALTASSSATCADERPGAYRVLCARLSPRDAVALLVGKARRHTEWARASVAEERGQSVAPLDALAEMRAERALDLVVARQALAALSELETLADPPATLADYEDAKRIGKVSAAEFAARLGEAAGTVARTLAWLPESPLKREIDRAWQSYADALWWWERGESAPVVRVTTNRYVAQNFAAMAHVCETQLGYNAVVNLRHARDYTRRAGTIAEAESRRAGFAPSN